MSEAAEFSIGAVVRCRDGDCGELRRVVIDSATEEVTSLVVEPMHRRNEGHLVPVDLVDATAAHQIRLRCTVAEFDALDRAEEIDVRPGLSVDLESQAASAHGFGAVGGAGALAGGPLRLDADGLGGPDVDGEESGMRKVSRGVTEDKLEAGQGEIAQGQHVHALDGPIGHVDGLVTDPGDHQLRYIVLGEGHLWGKKQVAIPVSAVKFVVDDGLYLNLTKKDVEELPAMDPAHDG